MEGLLSTVYTSYKNSLCKKTVITENVNHMAKCSSVNKKDRQFDMVLNIKLIDVTTLNFQM